jgi:hypothetical protein
LDLATDWQASKLPDISRKVCLVRLTFGLIMLMAFGQKNKLWQGDWQIRMRAIAIHHVFIYICIWIEFVAGTHNATTLHG